MWRWLAVTSLAFGALALGACHDSQEARLAKIKDEVCACKTAACGAAALKEVPQKDIQSNHRTQQIAREMLDCLANLDRGDAATDPGSAAGASEETP